MAPLLTLLISRFAVNQDVITKCNTAHDFFGLTPWYGYLPSSDFGQGDDVCGIKGFRILPGNGMKSDLPLVLLAVVDDLLKIAAIVAVGYIIYGAVQYMTSQGSPDATSKAQQTIINSLIGLVVAITAVAIVSFLGIHLGKAPPTT